MEINTEFFKTEKTARVSTYGTLSEKTKYFWFVLHGSNMVCEQMLYKFSNFNSEEHFIIAPEGLHRFYSNGFGGDVHASWMTSRDRLEEINDFSVYLSSLYGIYVDKLPKKCKKNILGFSQGGTTAFRWLHHFPVVFDCFIPYSCWVPEDIDFAESKTLFTNQEIIYTYGLEDQYLNSERIDSIQKIINSNQLVVKMEPYSGTHRIEKEQLKYLFEKYIQN